MTDFGLGYITGAGVVLFAQCVWIVVRTWWESRTTPVWKDRARKT